MVMMPEGRGYGHATGGEGVEADKRPFCQLSSKRLEDNRHSGSLSLSSTQKRLSRVRLPVGRKW